MALRRLSNEEMLHVSTAWLDGKSKAHKALSATALLAPLVPLVRGAHEALAKLAQPVADDPRLPAISEEEAAVDARHDDIIRGTHMLLTGAAYLLGTGTVLAGAELLALRDTVVPDGLESVKKTYRGEAGQAAQLELRLTPALRKVLESIAVGRKSDKRNLGQFVDEWLQHGKRLGELEDEKGRLQASAVSGPRGAATFSARNGWVQATNALLANATLAELDADTDALLFGPLRAAEKTADKRGRGGPVVVVNGEADAEADTDPMATAAEMPAAKTKP